jgi:hypothetical protein
MFQSIGLGFIAPLFSPFFILTMLLLGIAGYITYLTKSSVAFGVSALLIALAYVIFGVYPIWVGIVFILLGGFLIVRFAMSVFGG